MKDKEIKEKNFVDFFIAEVEGYTLWKEDRGKQGYLYTVYDPDMALVIKFKSYNDIEKAKNIKKSPVYKDFLDYVREDQLYGAPIEGEDSDDDDSDDTASKGVDDDNGSSNGGRTVHTGYNYPGGYYRGWDWDDDDDYGYGGYYSNPYWKGGSYKPTPKKTGFFDEYTKSDTVVFHKTDNTTDMLSQIYEGKGWDVFRSTYDLDEAELFKVVDAHKRVVCLGHGSGYGLIGMFGPEMAPHFKDKQLFIIWCNADEYFKKYSIGQGQFVTGNMPSEVWECSAAGCGSISKELMLENITYWSKLCADVTEACLNGNVKESVDYIRKNYLELYGNHPVTIYNCNRTQCLGEEQPLPEYEFKGKKLEGKDIPVDGFDEEAFLKNPTEKASECPRLPDYKPPVPKYEPKKGNAVTIPSNAKYVQQSLFDFDQYEKDYKEVKPFYDELAKGMTYNQLFARGIDTYEQQFVDKAEDHFKPRISRGDLYDMFYDWAEEKMREPSFYKQMVTSAQATPTPIKQSYTANEQGQKVCDFWATFLPYYTAKEFLHDKYIPIRNDLVKKAIEKFPNNYEETKLDDKHYQEELETLYYEWSRHLDNSKFKKPIADA